MTEGSDLDVYGLGIYSTCDLFECLSNFPKSLVAVSVFHENLLSLPLSLCLLLEKLDYLRLIWRRKLGKLRAELHAEEKRFGSFGCVGFCNLVSNCDYSAPVWEILELD